MLKMLEISQKGVSEDAITSLGTVAVFDARPKRREPGPLAQWHKEVAMRHEVDSRMEPSDAGNPVE